MKLIINGEEAKIPSGGSSGGVTVDQVNSAIDTKLDAYEPQEVYSTEEVRIGTWIDGKPLYRKVVQFTTPSTVNTYPLVANTGLDGIYLVSIFGATTDIYGSKISIPFVLHSSSTDIRTVMVNTNSSGSELYASVSNSVFANRQAHVVLEYTKTTDQAQTTAANTVLKAPSKAPALNSIQSAAVTASGAEEIEI